MPKLIGPDFVGIQAENLELAHEFYHDRLGLPVMAVRDDAVVFDSKPIPFAVRKPLSDLAGVGGHLGAGIAVWFDCDDADDLHNDLVAAGVTIVFPPKDGPFGRYFSFRDPFGYAITAHTA